MATRFLKAESRIEAESRIDWGKEGNTPLTIEEIACGCLLRIADAAEKMASNYTALQDEVAYVKKDRERLRSQCDRLCRSNAALRGCLKRCKKGGE